MTEIISKLREDHRHLVEIFDLIEREASSIEDGTEPGFTLLSNILEYIKYYPDVFHHPLEDLVFDCLVRRKELRPLVEKLQDEHLKLAEMTKAFRDAVTRAEETSEDEDRDRVGILGRAYVDAQRTHMTAEEQTVFPQAVGVMTRDEWDQVHDYAAAISPEADPVFGPIVTARYQELRRRIEGQR